MKRSEKTEKQRNGQRRLSASPTGVQRAQPFVPGTGRQNPVGVKGRSPLAGLRDGSPHRVKGETPWQVKGGSLAQGVLLPATKHIG